MHLAAEVPTREPKPEACPAPEPAGRDAGGGFSWGGLSVALVGPLPPPAGGMANQTRQLAELLEGEGVAVALVQVNAPYRPAWVGRLPILRACLRLPQYAAALWRALSRADLVHVMANSGWSWHLFAAPAVWLAWLRGVPAVVNYRGGGAGVFLAGSARLVRRTMGRAAALVVPSRFLLEVFAAHGMAGRVVPNVVNLARFSPAPQAQGRPARRRLVVPRNLEPIYGNDVALRAFASVLRKCPEATLAIAGSGPERQALERLAQELGVADRVRFTGRLDHDGMAALYREADVILNPTRVDNMPNSVLESLASGVPVVATRVGGVPYIVEDGRTALLVPPDDPEALADGVLRLFDDPGLARRLVANGLEDVARYRWEAVRDELGRVYGEALGRAAGGGRT